MNAFKKFYLILVLIVLGTVSSQVFADMYNFNGTQVNIEYWAGTGSNIAVVAVDFDGSTIYNFGYRWDGAAKGWDALNAIGAVANGLAVTAHYDGGVGGMYVDNLAYNNAIKYPAGNGWAYCTSTDGQAWETSWDGVSDRVLTNNSWDGWAWGGWQQNAQGDWVCRVVGQPVPEPVTLALLGLGGIIVSISRKRA